MSTDLGLSNSSNALASLSSEQLPGSDNNVTPLTTQASLRDGELDIDNTPQPDGWRTTKPVLIKPRLGRKRTAEENDIIIRTCARLSGRLRSDYEHVSSPNVDSPFVDVSDAVNRLLPYHVFQHPKEDLVKFARPRDEKGKGRAQFDEIEETEFALECFKRREALANRFKKIHLKVGSRSSPEEQQHLLLQAIVEAERSENSTCQAELRNARAELDRIERERRTTATPSPHSYYASTASQVQYYRGYPYSYGAGYGASTIHPVAMNYPGTTAFYSTRPIVPIPPAPIAPTVSTAAASAMSGAIPVQLPVASLPALHAIGIVPVPQSSINPAVHPQPPAILQGSTAGGTMLNLEINVPLLQPAQMSGLAMMLNSLVARGVPAGPGGGGQSGSSTTIPSSDAIPNKLGQPTSIV